MQSAARRVGGRHDLPEDWLNDRASRFWPADESVDDCDIVYDGGTLVVKVPPARVIFVMKLYRASPQDYEDMVALWPATGFAGPEKTVEAFWQAFPHAPADEHLVGYVAGIVEAAGA